MSAPAPADQPRPRPRSRPPATNGSHAYGPRPIGDIYDEITARQRHDELAVAQARLIAELAGDDGDFEAILDGHAGVIARRIALLNGNAAAIMQPAADAKAAAPDVSWRTLAEIPDDPPGELLLGMLEPDGPTLAYGAPGVGKGTSAAWLTCELQRLGMRVAIYDAERRPREWSRRVAGLGGDRSRVVYVDPSDLGRQYAGKPIWEAAPALRAIVAAAGIDLLIVDSILPAVGVGEERLRSDAQAPYLYVGALDALGIPSLSLGHPPKGQPEGEPFGSLAWVGATRLTWLGSAGEREGHQVRWRPRKRNERGHIPGVLLTFSYGDDGRPCAVQREDDEESTREWLLAALVPGPRTIPDLVDELLVTKEEAATDGVLRRTEERLGRTMRRLAHEGLTAKAGKRGRAVQWSLKLV